MPTNHDHDPAAANSPQRLDEDESAHDSPRLPDDFGSSPWFPGSISRRLLTRVEEVALGADIIAARDHIAALLESIKPARKSSPATPRGLGGASFRESETVAAIVELRKELTRVGAVDVTTGPSRSRKRRTAQPIRDGSTHAALRAVVDELDANLTRYRRARDRLVEANLRLVLANARRYRRSGVPTLDLIQEGTLGLMRAIEKWDPTRDVRFGTYAVWWIRQHIGLAGEVHAGLIRTPQHWKRMRRALGREAQRLEMSGKSFGRTELAAASGMSAENADLVQIGLQCLSLAEPAGGDDKRTLEEILPSPGIDADLTVAAAGLPQKLEQALQRLPEREASVLRLRFGTGGDTSRTLEEVAQRLGVSKERVRQIETKALRRLLPICEQQGLRGYFG